MKQKWEYRIERGLGLTEFAPLGDEGWELCGIRTVDAGIDYPAQNFFYFKRPRASQGEC